MRKQRRLQGELAHLQSSPTGPSSYERLRAVTHGGLGGLDRQHNPREGREALMSRPGKPRRLSAGEARVRRTMVVEIENGAFAQIGNS